MNLNTQKISAAFLTGMSLLVFNPISQASQVSARKSKPAAISANQSRVGDFLVSLKNCRKSSTSVKCSVTYRNEVKDIVFNTGRPENYKIVDLSGKVYAASSLEMGSLNATNHYYGSQQVTMSSKIDYETVLTFNDVPEEVLKAQVLSFTLENKVISFRNITISE